MANATTKSQLTPTFNRLNKLRRFLALSLLVTLSFNAFSADNFQQPNKEESNKEESNKEEFNKEAYLDLSKPYTHKQSNTTIAPTVKRFSASCFHRLSAVFIDLYLAPSARYLCIF
jgi:hypothetical protein